MPEEIDRGAGDERDELGSRKGVAWMSDHELVADRGGDDPGDDDDVKECVSVPREPSAIPGGRKPAL